MPNLSRRRFLARTAQGLAASALAAPVAAQQKQTIEQGSKPVPEPVQQNPQTEGPQRNTPEPLPPGQRVGFAIVGLGRLALGEIMPAFGQCKKAKPVALVSGHRDKAEAVARDYGLDPKNIYSYQDYDRIRDNPAVQVIYIVLPNGMHAKYTVRGAQAGKNILCEKPMATSVAECRQMIDACRKANVKLMIAYRNQYDPVDDAVTRMARGGKIGRLKGFISSNCQNMLDNEQWRLDKRMAGGGPLPDVGIYCLNTARFISGEEPVEIVGQTYATPGDPRFKQVEETCQFLLRFPSGFLANCVCSYGMHDSKFYRLMGDDAFLEESPAYSYRGLRFHWSHEVDGNEHDEEIRIEQRWSQLAIEMDHMADCVLQNRTPHTPGEEGEQDQRIMEAIYESARTGRPVQMPRHEGLDAFRGPAPPETGRGGQIR